MKKKTGFIFTTIILILIALIAVACANNSIFNTSENANEVADNNASDNKNDDNGNNGTEPPEPLLPTSNDYFRFTLLNDDTYEVSARYIDMPPQTIIPESYNGKEVTSIAKDGFKDRISIDRMTIPATVTNIADSAFSGCSGLLSISFSADNKMISIGSYAFQGCIGLTSLTIPNSVTNIGEAAFSGCSSIEKITIPFVGDRADITANDTIRYPIGYFFGEQNYSGSIDTTQYYKSSKYSKNYYIPSSLRTVNVTKGYITYNAFGNCSMITTIHFGENVTEIGSFAFQGCTNLNAITVESGNQLYHSSGNCLIETQSKTLIAGCNSSVIPVDGSVLSIAPSAFHERKSLSSISIPNGVESIPTYAFYGCTNLTSINIPQSVTSIGDWAFYSCGLTSVTIPNNILHLGNYAFSRCSDLTSISIPGNASDIRGSVFENCTGLTSLILSEGISYIPMNMFSHCSSLTSISIPDSVTGIGASAFEGCTHLFSATIGNRVTSISDKAFYSCYKLIEVYNRSSLSISKGDSRNNGYVGYYAKNVYSSSMGNSKLQENNGCIVYLDGSNKYFIAYVGKETNLNIPNTVTSIYQYALDGATTLSSISIPNSVTTIGDYAFNNCSGLSSITVSDNVTSIGNSAFANCSSLVEITVPFVGETKDGTTKTNFSYIFGSNLPSSLKTVIITGGSSIRNSAFSGCSELESITLPDCITSIGKNAFDKCSNLTSIVIPDGITTIDEKTFYCSGIASVTIPKTVKSIEINAFASCNNLNSITFTGTTEEWNQISKNRYWDTPRSSTVNYTIHCTNGDIHMS